MLCCFGAAVPRSWSLKSGLRLRSKLEGELQQEQAQEREAEIARNRRRPGRKAPYPC
jgi:hypothetical protein